MVPVLQAVLQVDSPAFIEQSTGERKWAKQVIGERIIARKRFLKKKKNRKSTKFENELELEYDGEVTVVRGTPLTVEL